MPERSNALVNRCSESSMARHSFSEVFEVDGENVKILKPVSILGHISYGVGTVVSLDNAAGIDNHKLRDEVGKDFEAEIHYGVFAIREFYDGPVDSKPSKVEKTVSAAKTRVRSIAQRLTKTKKK